MRRRRPRINRRSQARVAYVALAVVAAFAFFAIATSHRIYAPGSRALYAAFEQVFGEPAPWTGPGSVRISETYRFVRKAYSIVAFGIVGLLLAPAFPARVRLRACIAAIATFSGGIEIAQHMRGSNETHVSQAFDVACGAAGGALGAFVWNAVTRGRRANDRRAIARPRSAR